jgi:hypothetical protein
MPFERQNKGVQLVFSQKNALLRKKMLANKKNKTNKLLRENKRINSQKQFNMPLERGFFEVKQKAIATYDRERFHFSTLSETKETQKT